MIPAPVSIIRVILRRIDRELGARRRSDSFSTSLEGDLDLAGLIFFDVRRSPVIDRNWGQGHGVFFLPRRTPIQCIRDLKLVGCNSICQCPRDRAGLPCIASFPSINVQDAKDVNPKRSVGLVRAYLLTLFVEPYHLDQALCLVPGKKRCVPRGARSGDVLLNKVPGCTVVERVHGLE